MTSTPGSAGPSWPVKQREERTIESDSTIWNDFAFRSGDIIVGSYHKAGTTVTQQVVSQLLFAGKEDIPVWQLSPWLDFRLLPREEVLAQLQAQTHRRSLKTHLPADALPISRLAKYIYVARDGRDVAWSFHNHLRNAREAFNEQQWRHYDPTGSILPGYPTPPESPREFFLAWLEADGFPHGSFFRNVKTWWGLRHLPNVLLVHYNDLKADLRAQIIRIATFLDIALEELDLDAVVAHCSFDFMKAHSAAYAPMGGSVFKGGHSSFFHKGTNNRWKDLLSPQEIQQYEQLARERLGQECARWLATGTLGA